MFVFVKYSSVLNFIYSKQLVLSYWFNFCFQGSTWRPITCGRLTTRGSCGRTLSTSTKRRKNKQTRDNLFESSATRLNEFLVVKKIK
jgi:hypothetical protein